ncbi:hypothetical protein CVV68_20760 [Arthrobacter livingstonensis]|uniref:Cache domain-containing protein n=1 Tax=Arthrobacter livingstonensis TaxID=670078 RepID=A0A2V5L1B2_9MICC|nr:cache domain-containing protein [Arthrobacter livingstonensis]PYI64798.1 hypothetical protein CVV68_20760 [Arthrobacter livingstonensis]
MSRSTEYGRPAPGAKCAQAIGKILDGVFGTLQLWKLALEEGLAAGVDVDQLTYGLVEPALTESQPLLIGAGFIAAQGVVSEESGLHFAWWLGPLKDNPMLGTTSAPTRLDLPSREYADYLRDFRALEWYRVPEATGARHITGPYVDHLCTLDYLLTITAPVMSVGAMVGVVGADVQVLRLERDVLPLLRAVGGPAALVSQSGRVVISMMPSLQVGSLLSTGDGGKALKRFDCPGTSLAVVVETRP